MKKELPWATPYERINEYLDRIKRESEDQDRERREGRVVGELSSSLLKSLRKCNPRQLRTVKKLVREYVKDHKEPPVLEELDIPRSTRVVESQVHRNKLYNLELNCCNKPTCTKCPHGPYIYFYQRNGAIFPRKQLSEKQLSRLPPGIRELLRAKRDEVRAERKRYFDSLDGR